MSGIPKFNIPSFDTAADYLRREGFEVVSPAEIDGPASREFLLASPDGDHLDLPPGEPWSYYLARDFQILVDAGIDAIITLPGWEASRGARLEVMLGRELGIPNYPFDAYDPILGFEDSDEFPIYEDNPERQRQVTGGVKDNASKSRVDLIPSKPLIGAGHVLAFGARKYKPHNWRLGLLWSDTLASAMRHLLAFADGEDTDPETGLPHIDQALCQVLFQSEYYHTETGIDDRWASLSEAERGQSKA
jgi:hypothetical protein